VRQQPEALEHHRQVLLPQAPQLARAHLGDVDLAVVGLQPHVAGGGRDQAVDAAQQRRLAGARQPHDDEELARTQPEGDVLHADHVARAAKDLVLAETLPLQFERLVGVGTEHLVERFDTDHVGTWLSSATSA